MNTVTNASSYYTANVDEMTEKEPCVAMTPYGIIGLERVNDSLKISRHSHFELHVFFAVRYFRENMVHVCACIPLPVDDSTG